MADEVDKANELVERNIQTALNKQKEHTHIHTRHTYTSRTHTHQKHKAGAVVCMVCDIEIPAARLKAIETATMCVKCAGLNEKRAVR